MMHRSPISRRRVLQGGAAAGIALGLPALPLPAVAQQRRVALESTPLDTTAAFRAPAPAPASAHGGSLATASVAQLRLPALDLDPFTMVALSWRGGPTGGASLRVRDGSGWRPWYGLHVDPSEGPDDVDLDLRFTAPVWVGEATGVEVSVPDGVEELTLHRVVKTSEIVATLATRAAGAAPAIRPRSAWGARSFRGTPDYSSRIILAVIHHSATANGYSPGDVPGMIAGIQAFHQDGRGWSDIAYNFVVDRFGGLWEGRAGGIDRPVIGGHAFGANTSTIGVCYLGTASASAPISNAALATIGSLLRWKFNRVHLVAPDRTTTYTPRSANSASKHPAGVPVTLNLVIGHSTMVETECPGQVAGRIDDALLRPMTTPSNVLGVDAAPGGGFWLTTADGQAFPRAGARFHGSMSGEALNSPMLGLAPTPSGGGYWMLGGDGGIFTFGDARFHGSTGGMGLNRPVVGMATTPTGNGYWLVASDGGIFAFGDAGFYGSTGGMRLNQPVVGMARTPSGRGYWLFASDGGIFAFGDAGFFGSAGDQRLPSPAVSVGAHPSGSGYWLVLGDGTVIPYGVPRLGSASVPASDPVVGIAVTPSGGGYWLATRSGVVHRFGDAS